MHKLNTHILDSLNSHIAVLDKDGVILYTNKTWDNFYKKNKKGLTNKKSGIGVNYLDRCLEASKKNKDALYIYKGIKSVINGETGSFNNRYSVDDDNWYSINVCPLESNKEGKVVITYEDITKKEKAENKLLQVQKEMSNILDHANVGIVYANSDKEVVRCNEKFLKVFGYKKEEDIIGKPMISFTSPDHQKMLLKEVKKIILSETDSIYVEKLSVRKDGSVFWASLNISAIRDSEEVLTNFVGMLTDITEKKIAEEELQKSENRYKMLYERNLAGVYRADMNDNFLDCNDAYARIIGFKSSKDVVGKNAKKLYKNITHTPFFKYVNDQGGRINNVESTIITKSGKEVYLLENGSIVNDKDGNPSYIEGTVFDISEIRISQQALIESEDRLKLATSSANIGVWDWDIKNDALFWDDSMYKLFEVKKEDFSGAYEAWEKTLYVYDVATATKEVEMALSGEKKFDTIFRILTEKKKIKYIQARANVEFDSKGNAIRMVGVNIDVTDKELMEQEKHNAIIKTEEAERQRISHDLHDGLGQRIAAANMWINTLGGLVKNQLDEETMSVFKAGKQLINDATKETRLVSHNIMPRSLKQYGLEKTVIELVSNMQIISENVSIKLTSNINETRFGEIKELSIFRVLQESINNALKHAKADKIEVILNIESDMLFVNVNDNGKGFVVKEAMDKKTTGIGLLSLSQRINMIGGKLNIESKPSEGTKIAIVIYLDNKK